METKLGVYSFWEWPIYTCPHINVFKLSDNNYSQYYSSECRQYRYMGMPFLIGYRNTLDHSSYTTHHISNALSHTQNGQCKATKLGDNRGCDVLSVLVRSSLIPILWFMQRWTPVHSYSEQDIHIAHWIEPKYRSTSTEWNQMSLY